MLDDPLTLLSRVPENGDAIDTQKLRHLLGWEESRYLGARQTPIDQGMLEIEQGKAGAVRRRLPIPEIPAPKTAPKEMFAAEDISSPAPPKRADAGPAAKLAKSARTPGPAVTNYQFPHRFPEKHPARRPGDEEHGEGNQPAPARLRSAPLAGVAL